VVAAGPEPFERAAAALPAVRGFLHRPPAPSGEGLVLTHGAGGDCQSPLLQAVGAAFAAAGLVVLRCDLPYRQARRVGPPSPAGATRDRQGLTHAVLALETLASRGVFLGGQSYGGRQASLLAAEAPQLTRGLLLLSYPLHPPGRPAELRTTHLPQLQVPTLFVHGDADPFGSLAELGQARALVPAATQLLAVQGGHDLGWGRRRGRDPALPARIVSAFRALLG
jgi:predicted alpha/beta-hydrolase family hydrolase